MVRPLRLEFAGVLQTARAAYAKALNEALPSQLEQALADETLKFN